MEYITNLENYIFMLGMIFLAATLGIIGYLAASSAWVAGVAATVGFGFEPISGYSLFTDWLTWALTDVYGLFLLAGMGFVSLVVAINVSKGDASQ